MEGVLVLIELNRKFFSDGKALYFDLESVLMREKGWIDMLKFIELYT